MEENNQSQIPDREQIQSIFDQEIRPALQMHGGDVQLISAEDNVIKINYHGACGGCPAATSATLAMITAILREKYHPNTVVKIA